MTTLYNIDRQAASNILGVSVRTIDRYISSGKIRKVKNQGRTWLSNSDVQEMLRQNQETGQSTQSNSNLSQTVNDFSPNKNVSSAELVSEDETTSNIKDKYVSDLEKIYEDTKKDLEDKNKKLQQAVYKIGQLESQIKNMVPLIEIQKRERLLLQNNENLQSQLNNEVQKREQVVKNLLSDIKHKELELETERFNKAIFAILLFLTILTLIMILIYKSN